MAIIATTTQGGNKVTAPEGNHIARCVQMIHLGTTEQEFKKEVKKLNKVRVVWELLNESYTYTKDDQEVTSNFLIGKDYTLSMHEKSSLRKDLQSWRGKAFTEDEAKAFDITKLLNIPCMLNVIHKKADNGNEYANISGISQMPKGMVAPNPTTPLIEFNYDDKFEVFETLPEWLQNKIKESEEYKHKMGDIPVTSDDDDSDEIPF